jgi:hypothetical protein
VVVVKPEDSPSQLAFGRLMRTLGVYGPRKMGQLRQTGKQMRALTGKVAKRGG